MKIDKACAVTVAAATAVLFFAAASSPGIAQKKQSRMQPVQAAAKPGPTPDEAFKRLEAGHARFLGNARTRPNQTPLDRQNLANGQRPFAVVFGCSDSRVVPEMVFDQGFGDLFVVRTAGHTVDPLTVGSLEYAVKHLKSPLVLVLGHERCGAVKAAVEGKVNEGSIPNVAAAIKPAVERARGREGDLIDHSIRENVRVTLKRLREESPIVQRGVKNKTLRLVGGYYDLDTGKVSFIQ